jgi:hypothetical protein
MTAIIKRTAAFLAMALIFTGCGEVTPDDNLGNSRDNPIHLYENSFKNGNVVKDGEQWFSFTATSAGRYYIHIIFETAEYLNVRVFNHNGSPIGGEAYLPEYSSPWYFFRDLPGSGTYRIRVRPYYSDSGTYKIAFNTTIAPPQ